MTIGTIVAILLVITAIIFRKQILAGITTAKRKMDNNTSTATKLEMAIKTLKEKRKKAKFDHKQTITTREQINLLAINELKTLIDTTGLVVEAVEDYEGVKTGETYTVKGFYKDEDKGIENCNFFNIGLRSCYNRNLFKLVGDGKHVDRYRKLVRRYELLQKRVSKIDAMVVSINNSITSFENDKKYYATMESLVSLEQFDEKLDLDIDTINAELTAIEEQLEAEDRWNGEDEDNTDIPQSK